MVENQQLQPAFFVGEVIEESRGSRLRRIALRNHIRSYAAVNSFLVLVWALTGGGYPWFLWVMLGWGIGLAMHANSYLIFKTTH